MKLKVLQSYQNRKLSYEKGTTIEVPESEGQFLKADAPGCFKEVVEKEQIAPKDKQVHKNEVKTK